MDLPKGRRDEGDQGTFGFVSYEEFVVGQGGWEIRDFRQEFWLGFDVFKIGMD